MCQGHAASEKSGLVSAKNGGRDRHVIVKVLEYVIVELGLAFPNLQTDRETELVVVRSANSRIVGLMNNFAPGGG